MITQNWVKRLRSRLSLKIEPVDENCKCAAVSVMLTGDNDIETLMIKRLVKHDDPWSGQIAFPGGRFKAGDGNLLSTMIREVYEELGINLAGQGEIIGSLSIVSPGNVPDLKVTPYVVALKKKPMIIPSHEEVEKAFWVKLNELRPGESEVITVLGPRVVSGFFYKNYFIWGMTSRILKELLALL
ncbi:MAG: CoA pyrophosphatase [Thermoprotei archaeon]